MCNNDQAAPEERAVSEECVQTGVGGEVGSRRRGRLERRERWFST